MLGLESYGSDESDSDVPVPIQSQSPKKAATEDLSGTSKSLLSLPPPVNSGKPRPKRAVFTVTKPATKGVGGDVDVDEDEDAQRAAKKPKLDSKARAGSSSLLAMLPAPSKSTLPVSSKVQKSHATTINEDSHEDNVEESVKNSNDTLLVPVQSLRNRNKARPDPSKSSVDFFSLASSFSNTSSNKTSSATSPTAPSVSLPAVSSAPSVPTFEPPEPTPEDPYPGYYQLPSGQWDAYDPEYYMKYYNTFVAESQRVEKGFEGVGDESTVQIDAQEQLDLARKERQDRKALTRNAGGGPSAPRMNIKAAKAGSLAKTRHQLSTLLTEAYENREALEERIAQAKRNRKESGNKYGF